MQNEDEVLHQPISKQLSFKQETMVNCVKLCKEQFGPCIVSVNKQRQVPLKVLPQSEAFPAQETLKKIKTTLSSKVIQVDPQFEYAGPN